MILLGTISSTSYHGRGITNPRFLFSRPFPKYAFKLLFASDFLVNLSNSVRLQAPSKLLELVSTGKPVINFYFHQDSGYHIIEKYPLGININNKQSFDDIFTSVTNFIENNKGKAISFAELERIYPDHLFANQRVKFRSIVNNNVKQ